MRSKSNLYPAIREVFICRAALADYLGRSENYVSLRLSGKKEFSPAEKIAISVAVGQDWSVIECT